MATTSYAFATGSVRARENALLTRQEFDGLLLVADEKELAARLRDRGYGDPAEPAADVEGLLRQETARLWDYLWTVAPDREIFDAFLYRNDIHNAKVAIKTTLSGRQADGLYLPDGTIPAATLREAAQERAFDGLPDWLAQAMERAYELVAHARDAGLADAVIDRAGMEAMQAAAERTGDEMLRDFFAELVFYNDIKIIVRAIRTGKGSAFMEQALCPCDGVDADEWIRVARGAQGEEEFLSLLERLNYRGCAEAAQAFRTSPLAFERYAEDRLVDVARRAVSVTMGPALLVGYLFAKETEIRALHMLASGIRTGEEREAIRERGRLCV